MSTRYLATMSRQRKTYFCYSSSHAPVHPEDKASSQVTDKIVDQRDAQTLTTFFLTGFQLLQFRSRIDNLHNYHAIFLTPTYRKNPFFKANHAMFDRV